MITTIRAFEDAWRDLDYLEEGFAWALRHRVTGSYLTELHESGVMTIRVWMRKRHAERDRRAWRLDGYETTMIDLYEGKERRFFNPATGLL